MYLPIQIAGISSLDIHNAWRAVVGRIALVQGRFSFEEFGDWLSLAATQQRYALNLNNIERMNASLANAGFKRGLDAEHLKRSLSADDQDYRFSLKFALDRLALGVAVPEHCVVQHTVMFLHQTKHRCQHIYPSILKLTQVLHQLLEPIFHRFGLPQFMLNQPITALCKILINLNQFKDQLKIAALHICIT